MVAPIILVGLTALSLDINTNFLVLYFIASFAVFNVPKQLFFIAVSIPFTVDFKGSEVKVYQNLREVLDYVYKTEELIRPYYTVEKE